VPSDFKRPFPEAPNEIHLRLVKTHDKEVICDQHGRELQGVTGFRYEQTEPDSIPVLVLKLVVNACDWSKDLGVVQKGEAVKFARSALEPSRIE
jgi:hypothetical protein